MNSDISNRPINLYLSAEHECSYLDNRLANSLFVDPESSLDTVVYSSLIQRGFRRSGNYVYTPHCNHCHDCIPVRLDVQQFSPSRSQKRCCNRNKQLKVRHRPAAFSQVHYDLYSKYVISRHSGGGMDEPSTEKYLDFLISDWCETTFFEFRENDNVVSIAVTDIIEDGFSAVYTFFASSPSLDKRSLGVFSILWQIEEARRRGLRWLYLGYWIKKCAKMNYKDKYQPLQYYYNYEWHPVPPPETS
jgi:arginine-tRNA-protein transferase